MRGTEKTPSCRKILLGTLGSQKPARFGAAKKERSMPGPQPRAARFQDPKYGHDLE